VTRDYFGNVDLSFYKIDTLKNTTIDAMKNARQWTYQTCTELGYFQTAHQHIGMRASVVDIEYFKDLCEQVFGKDIWPNVNHTNLLMGETHLARPNIFFTNGGEDPWKWAGETSVAKHSGMEAQVVDCENCAHCVELYTPKDSDSNKLKHARRRISEWLDRILHHRGSQVEQAIKQATQ